MVTVFLGTAGSSGVRSTHYPKVTTSESDLEASISPRNRVCVQYGNKGLYLALEGPCIIFLQYIHIQSNEIHNVVALIAY